MWWCIVMVGHPKFNANSASGVGIVGKALVGNRVNAISVGCNRNFVQMPCPLPVLMDRLPDSPNVPQKGAPLHFPADMFDVLFTDAAAGPYFAPTHNGEHFLILSIARYLFTD